MDAKNKKNLGLINQKIVTPNTEIELLQKVAYYPRKFIKDGQFGGVYSSISEFVYNICEKLFIELDSTTKDTSKYLKNKYLYWSMQGAIYYLEADIEVNKDPIEIIGRKKEEESLKKFWEHLSKTESSLYDKSIIDVVSLGSGNGIKDCNALHNFNFGAKNYYIPIDISPYLIQITTNNFISIYGFERINNIKPVIANFFDLADLEDLSKIFPSNRIRFFSLFGQTLANYIEIKLLKAISKVMNYNDVLLIGFELLDRRLPDPYDEVRKKDLVVKYRNSANINFLLQPLTLMPTLTGLLTNPKRYLEYIDDIFEFKSILSSIPKGGSMSYVPKITIEHPTIMKEKGSEEEMPQKEEIHIAWSTKYYYRNLKDFLLSKPVKDLGLYLIEEIQHGGIDADYVVFGLRKKNYTVWSNTKIGFSAK